MDKLLTKDNILATISILAFIMSLSTWVLTFINQKRKLKIRVVHYYRPSMHHFFLVSIENLSRLPVIISQIYLLNEKNEKIDCMVMPKEILTITKKSGDIEKSKKSIYNIQIPISLPTLGGISGYIGFEDYQEIVPSLTTDVSFEVHTNRGRSFRLKLPLNQIVDTHYFLHR